MAAVQPAGPLPRMMTLECMVVMARLATFAGLAMSYRNGKDLRQVGSKAKSVHKVRDASILSKLLAVSVTIREILLLWSYTHVIAPRPSNRTFVLDIRKLDAIDLRILAELQAVGRITHVALSRRP